MMIKTRNYKAIITLIALIITFAFAVAPSFTYASNELGTTIEDGSAEEEREDIKMSDFFKKTDFLTPEDMEVARQMTQPLFRVLSTVLSAGFYLIIALNIFWILPDIIYIQFPFSRKMLGGNEADSRPTPNVGHGYGYQGGMYGGGHPEQGNYGTGTTFFKDGLVSDDARVIALDPNIQKGSKLGMYLKRKIVNMIVLAMALVLLTSSVWMGIGFSIGDLILKWALQLLQWLQNPAF